MSFWIFPTKFPHWACSRQRNLQILISVKMYLFFLQFRVCIGRLVNIARSGRGYRSHVRHVFRHLGMFDNVATCRSTSLGEVADIWDHVFDIKKRHLCRGQVNGHWSAATATGHWSWCVELLHRLLGSR